ncbi:hypothetical protein EVAR_44049_1 [Eumeta japonica]|uniref:Uncharacterized protein n=1 Tax=Eumeta variegata TaxID=151549 RepID=A0A4C1XGI0_EUMVA|nr:hypothetical protein EVAR_44049_1 [Eumeta japonica]
MLPETACLIQWSPLNRVGIVASSITIDYEELIVCEGTVQDKRTSRTDSFYGRWTVNASLYRAPNLFETGERIVS